MPRPKGSKNKTKTVKATVDFAAQIAEKQSAKEAAAAEIASITVNIDALKADLKTKKAELKSIDKEIARIEAKKVKAETKAAESAKKAEAEDVLKKLLASGVSADSYETLWGYDETAKDCMKRNTKEGILEVHWTTGISSLQGSERNG